MPGSEDNPNFIDPEELPFTTDEIVRAGRTFLDDTAARDMAEHLQACAEDLIAARAKWRVRGADGSYIDLPGRQFWVYPEELLPALAELSPDAAARVARLRGRAAGDGSEGAV